jgi:endonuclease-8
MPEGDTVRRTALRLHQALGSRALIRAELRWPDLGQVDLTGWTVAECAAYGKHILLRLTEPTDSSAESETEAPVEPVGRPRFEPQTLHSHLRMDGSWRIHATGSQPWPSQDQFPVRAVLANEEWTAVGVWLGELDLLPTAAESTLIGHLGPDILSDTFPDPAEPWGVTEALHRIAADPSATIGAALLDQRNLAGIGTFYLSEALFVLGISPWALVADVPNVATAVERARRMLTANLVRATPTTTGDTRPGNRQWVHARSGHPCRRCGTTIRVAPLEVHPRSPGQTAGLERTIFYCPRCQHGVAPTDDDRPQQPLGTAGSDRRKSTGTAASATGTAGRSLPGDSRRYR